MKKLIAPLGAAVVLAFLVCGCESSNVRTARIQEKSSVYATLTPIQKKVIDEGAFEVGYSTDMVYMALGSPKSVKTKDVSEGKVEMWTYTNYYPTIAAATMSLNNPGTGANYQMMQTSSSSPQHGYQGGRGGASPSLFTTSGGPTPTLDVADIPSHTLYVLFFNGKVFDIKINNEG